jgi:hypothetical protein
VKFFGILLLLAIIDQNSKQKKHFKPPKLRIFRCAANLSSFHYCVTQLMEAAFKGVCLLPHPLTTETTHAVSRGILEFLKL